VTLGVIVGNRGFFPGHLAAAGRIDMLRALEEEGIDLNECFTLHASIRKHPASKSSPQSIFHPFYIHKEDSESTK
jgi:hypothetical protein